MKKILFSVLLICCMAAFVFAGGTNDKNAAAAGEEEITILHMFANPIQDANSVGHYAMMEKFRQDYPNVKLNIEAIPHDEYETKMKTYISGGEYPDIFLAKGTMVPQLADDGVLYTAKEVMDLVPGWEAMFKGGVFDDSAYKNIDWGVPFQMGNNHNIYWNTEIFAECGITEFPADYPSFVDAMEKIKAKGYTPIVLGNKGNWLVPSLFLNTIIYRYTGIDWYFSLRSNGGAKFTDKPFVDAVALLQQMARNGYFNTDINSIDQQQMYTVYYNKRAAMMVDGFWGVGTFLTQMPKDVLDATKIAQFPSVPESMGGGGAKYGKINQAAAGWSYYTVKRDTDTPEKRKNMALLLSYLTGSEEAKIVVENGGLPAANAVGVDESKLPPLYRELLRLNNESQYAPVFDVQLNPQVVDVFYANTQDLLIDRITPERYAEMLQTEMDNSK